MLSSISWSQFLYGLGIALVIYYVYIAFKYYGDELNAILKGKSPKSIVTPSSPDQQRVATSFTRDSLLGKSQVDRPAPLSTNNSVAQNPIAVKSSVLPEPEEYDEPETTYETVEQIDLDLQDGGQSYADAIPVESFIDLVDGIDNVITDASENERDKDSMANALRALLEPHQNLNSKEFRENITEHIVKTAEQTGAPVISKAEVSGYWDKAFAGSM